jgi:pimeloyl-ACP methyl ester carboxylesterase
VILVGHDFGGACISYAMEMFPSKVAKAVFLCAAMLKNGHSTLDMFQQQVHFYHSINTILKIKGIEPKSSALKFI